MAAWRLLYHSALSEHFFLFSVVLPGDIYLQQQLTVIQNKRRRISNESGPQCHCCNQYSAHTMAGILPTETTGSPRIHVHTFFSVFSLNGHIPL